MAAANTNIKNSLITCATGVVQNLTLESGCVAIAMLAIGGNCAFEDPDGNEFTLLQSSYFPLNSSDLRNRRLAFDGATGVTVQVMQILGEVS